MPFMPIHPDIKKLIEEIDAFRAETRMSVTAFGLGAVNNGKLIPTLASGRQLLPKTMDRIRAFMEKHRVAA